MESDVRARLFWIVVAAVLAVWAILARPLVLGLDLEGGVTMRYQLEPPDTLAAGDLDEMVQTTVDTLRSRIDAYGILESVVSRQGSNEILIELPGRGKEGAEAIRTVISRVGHLEWRIAASDDDQHNVMVATETARLAELLAREENLGRLPDQIDVSSLDLKFDDVLYRWIPYTDKKLAERRGLARLADLPSFASDRPLADAPLVPAQPGQAFSGDYLLMRVETARQVTFTGVDIARAYYSQDSRQGQAVGVEIIPSRSSEFGDWTEGNQGQLLGIVLDGRLAEPPATINDRLEGSFIIQSGSAGGFTSSEMKDYLTIIKSGSLQMKPRLLYENTVGPSLGESAREAGQQASAWAFAITLAFLLFYYRSHGVIAALVLVFNLLLMYGVLVALGATLTLPGIAGLVLSLGVSVDANILVFERMREESDRARSVDQVVKLGFDKAFATIMDSNITSLVSAFILYKLGAGPVRGFAVVLIIGILTALFSVLVFGKLLYQIVLARGWLTQPKMMRLLKEQTDIGFMSKTRLALVLSGAAIVLSLVGFGLAGDDKYGLDFLGGYKAQVRLARPATHGEVQQAVARVFPGAQVVSVTGGESETEQSNSQFLVKVKADAGVAAAGAGGEVDLAATYERPLKEALAGLVLPDPFVDVQVQEDPASQTTRLRATLNFDGPVEPEKVAARLGFLGGIQVEAVGPSSVTISGTLARLGVAEKLVLGQVHDALAGASGLPLLSEPLVESVTIGSRVGTELRDKAIQALLLSFAAIILYIRVRFRGYGYGIAAVVGLIHDVIITLGCVVLVHQFGIVDIELDLTMVAVFLTVIGYSLNDKIVLFDRVRENLPRLAKPLPEVIDVSMNQVLARTLLTSSTTLLALAVIFVLNLGKQNALEGFSFAMIVGVIVGTYSSIFIASPVLVMLHTRRGEAAS